MKKRNREETRQYQRNKNKTFYVTALILMLTFSGLMAIITSVSAHYPPWTISTYSFISVEPNPVGVGQTAYISYWLDKVPPTAEGNWGYKWHNMTVTVTKPDGHTETLGPFNSDAVGGAWASYVPDQVGTYKFVGSTPTQTIVNENPYPYPLGGVDIGLAFVNDTYTGSTSEEVDLVVQQQQVTTAFPPNPLPTGYWQRPISSMNREWYSLGGNWLGLAATTFGFTGMYNQNGNFNPYTTAPDSAHIVWTKPLAFGGQIGGEFGSSETSLYATGTAYETKFGAVILYGILYYTSYPGAMNDIGPLTAVNIRTGETLWTVNASNTLKCGMVYDFITGDQYGGHAYVFTETPTSGQGFILPTETPRWSMYDAMTGQWILDIANATSATLAEGPNGEILSYRVSGGMLSLWNVSKCIATASQEINKYRVYSSAEIWRPPLGATIDWSGGIEWSVPVATASGEPLSLGLSKVTNDVLLLTQSAAAVPGGSNAGWRVDAGFSPTTGQLLWGPINRTLTPWSAVALGPADEGVYTEYTRQTLTWTGYSLQTGEKLWTTVPKNSTWGYYDYTADGVIGYGNLYSWGLGGEVYAYDLQTGNVKWYWNAGSAGIDTPYGTWPLGTWSTHHVLADGKLYVAAGHDYTPPVFKGANLYCIDATSGQELWNCLTFNIEGSPACADGYLLWFNGYDNQVYCYNAGLSATTVTVSPKVSNAGSNVLIEGTVTDQSPGQTCLGIPAAGTPAISDDDMGAWMEYLYEQQPMPTNAKGVSVHVTAIDPNGNTQEIGTTASDTDSNFGISWTPPVPGLYKVTATFEGSKSYYSSHAETMFVVSTAASGAVVSPSPSPTQAPQPGTNEVPTTMLIAIVLAVVIIAIIAAAIAIRRRR